MKKETNLDFAGMAGDGVNRKSGCYTGNQYGATMPVNAGQGPRKGNTSGNPAGAPKTIATAAQGGRPARHRCRSPCRRRQRIGLRKRCRHGAGAEDHHALALVGAQPHCRMDQHGQPDRPGIGRLPSVPPYPQRRRRILLA